METYVIIGATGHVGSAVVRELLQAGESVIAVAHDAAKGQTLAKAGAEVAEADVRDTDALRRIFQRGQRVFLLNPPADPAGDADAEERRTIASLVGALNGSGVEKVVAQSTYGAQRGERIGDLGTLWGMEQALEAQPIPVTIQRGAYYMSNWDAFLESARDEGVIHSMLPAGLMLPMVAPEDLGRRAAGLLREPIESTGIRHTEGPEPHTPQDTADAFSRALGRPVHLVETPRAAWEAAYRGLGFSAQTALSFANMAALSVDGPVESPERPFRGSTTLQEYIDALCRRAG